MPPRPLTTLARPCLTQRGFGILILVTELKSWPIISTFQKRVDIYFHLLSVPKGKGGFYCFIGFLAFCAR